MLMFEAKYSNPLSYAGKLRSPFYQRANRLDRGQGKAWSEIAYSADSGNGGSIWMYKHNDWRESTMPRVWTTSFHEAAVNRGNLLLDYRLLRFDRLMV